MQQNETLNAIIELIEKRRLGKAIDELENYLLSHTGLRDMEILSGIKSDYQLMAEYWQRGFDDPKRAEVYEKLLRRLYMLTVNVMIHQRIRNSSFLNTLYNRPRQIRKDWSMSNLKQDLETFVSTVAVLELEPPHTRQEKLDLLYQEHQCMMHDLFDYILTSRLWKDCLAEAFEDILLSPTIDINDQQLIVSAVTISAMNAFGPNKFNVLMHVYQKATDERLRQRALVGWVLSMNADRAMLYTEMKDVIREVCSDERCCKEITELQMQMLYCMDAESDTKKIQNEIMPDLMAGNNLRITGHGIEQVEDDALEDILHPDAAEQNMERMEQSMQRMVEMQKQGSDIYFGGFSQMKRFPFFNDVLNWFVPFYPQHPSISQLWNKSKGMKFLHKLTKVSAFCDSDIYSFVLAFDQVYKRLPEDILKVMNDEEASPVVMGGEISAEKRNEPAFIRRMYLQNLYRFFMLFPFRSEFENPFAADAELIEYAFFGNKLFRDTPLEKHFVEVAAFMVKHHRYKEAQSVLENCSEQSRDYQFYMLNGSVLRHFGRMNSYQYQMALSLKPGDEKAMAALARAYFTEGAYEGSMKIYEDLLQAHPDNKSYQLNDAVCLIHVKRYEEAMTLLYKLSYLYPDDEEIQRVFAWGLTVNRKFEQAEKIYSKLLSTDEPRIQDTLNYGYCLWFEGKPLDASSIFRALNEKHVDFEKEFRYEEQLIAAMGIDDAEKNLMLDTISVGH